MNQAMRIVSACREDPETIIMTGKITAIISSILINLIIKNIISFLQVDQIIEGTDSTCKNTGKIFPESLLKGAGRRKTKRLSLFLSNG